MLSFDTPRFRAPIWHAQTPHKNSSAPFCPLHPASDPRPVWQSFGKEVEEDYIPWWKPTLCPG